MDFDKHLCTPRNELLGRRRMSEDIGTCLECGVIDDGVDNCIAPDCTVHLHDYCGTVCGCCNFVACPDHITKYDDLKVCPLCLPEIIRLNSLEKCAEVA